MAAHGRTVFRVGIAVIVGLLLLLVLTPAAQDDAVETRGAKPERTSAAKLSGTQLLLEPSEGPRMIGDFPGSPGSPNGPARVPMDWLIESEQLPPDPTAIE